MNNRSASLTSNSRKIAARLLYQWLQHGHMPARQLEKETEHRAFVTEMVLGVVRHQQALKWILQQLAPRTPPDDLTPVLLVGLYQLLVLDHVEPYAAVHETVEATKILCDLKKAGFVNAVLRRALREKESLLAKLEMQPTHIRHSHPREMVTRWIRQFGAETTQQLCAWNNERPELIVRIRLSISPEGFVNALKDAGLQAAPHQQDGFFILPPGLHIQDCPGYAEGWFMVQDPATRLAVDLLDPQPGERILDACAAPGGKTVAVADRMNHVGTLVACDINPQRMRKLESNLHRCNLKWVRPSVINILNATLDLFDNAPFDAVLLDVPCSNTGVIRRRPDARCRLTKKHLTQLLNLQREILTNASTLLRPGGRLVYSSCSLEHEENDGQIAAWLADHPAFRLDTEIRSFPPRDRMDGAYAARLVRRDY